MKLKAFVKFVLNNKSMFTSSESIEDLAAYSYINYRFNFSVEEIAEYISQCINPIDFKHAYAKAKSDQIRIDYLGGDVFRILREQDIKIQKNQMHANKLKSRTCLGGGVYSRSLPRASATDMRKDSAVFSISGGMISTPSSRYAKLFEDYDDR